MPGSIVSCITLRIGGRDYDNHVHDPYSIWIFLKGSGGVLDMYPITILLSLARAHYPHDTCFSAKFYGCDLEKISAFSIKSNFTFFSIFLNFI